MFAGAQKYRLSKGHSSLYATRCLPQFSFYRCPTAATLLFGGVEGQGENGSLHLIATLLDADALAVATAFVEGANLEDVIIRRSNHARRPEVRRLARRQRGQRGGWGERQPFLTSYAVPKEEAGRSRGILPLGALTLFSCAVLFLCETSHASHRFLTYRWPKVKIMRAAGLPGRA